MIEFKLYKKAERTIEICHFLKANRMQGWKTTHLGEYDKWKELSIGGTLQVKMDVYRIDGPVTFYVMSDTLGHLAAPAVEDVEIIYSWLKEKGYKPDKQWYMEDFGMSEETWAAWNGEDE